MAAKILALVASVGEQYAVTNSSAQTLSKYLCSVFYFGATLTKMPLKPNKMILDSSTFNHSRTTSYFRPYHPYVVTTPNNTHRTNPSYCPEIKNNGGDQPTRGGNNNPHHPHSRKVHIHNMGRAVQRIYGEISHKGGSKSDL